MKTQSILRSPLVFALSAVIGLSPALAQDAAKPTPPASDASVDGAAKKAEASPAINDAQIKDILNRVARRQLRQFGELKEGEYKPVENLEQAKALAPAGGISWGYPWGVTLYGTMRSTDVTGDKEVQKFVLEHNRIVAKEFNYLWNTVHPKAANNAEWRNFCTNRARVKIRGLLTLGHLDSCGAMGVEFLESMLRHPESVTEEHKAVAARIADWIAVKQQRLPDGTFSRPGREMGTTLWIDDLYMGCPYLVRWAKFTGEKKHLDDAARNVINMASRLQDTDGLWYHGYFVEKSERSPIKWGRGAGWAMVATVEVLSAMDENHPDRAKMLDILRRYIEGVKKVQAPSGMWRQILNRPDTWEETSCTAMFAYSIARAVNRGWIDKSNMDVARKAFAGMSKYVTEDGSVNGTCEGTNIGMDDTYYINRRRPDDDLHGRGVVLLAGTEILAGK